MKILLTGSSGFIGQALTPRLNSLGDIYHLNSDLLDYKSVNEEIAKVAPDIIVHLAARTEVEKSFYEQTTFSEVNYVGTVNLIESAVKLDNIPYFVFASTMEVYGWQPISDLIKVNQIPEVIPAFDETTVPHPNAPYAVAKLACEKYLEYAHRAHNLDYAIIRQTNAYGRKDNDFFVTEQIITQMLKSPDNIYLGYAKPFRNFIHIDDLLDAWEVIVANRSICKNNIFTLGPDAPVQIEQHAKNIGNLLGWNGTINWDTKPKRHGEIYLLNSNSNKLTQLTGWQPKISYTQGLLKTIDIWKNNLSSTLTIT